MPFGIGRKHGIRVGGHRFRHAEFLLGFVLWAWS
jgi:hypothetical protein